MSHGKVKPSELAEVLGVHVSTVYNWIKSGDVKKDNDGLLDADLILKTINPKAKKEQEEASGEAVSVDAVKKLILSKVDLLTEAENYYAASQFLDLLDDITRL